eukprot:GGOE01054657.1.p1 GENE.GGOE01054657.1~~GGOE01054657.1.p1  ORF type:complete len:329 (+),score=102.44 GGOE01054657.1:15-1001(+)
MSKGEGVCVCVRLRCEAPPNGLLTVRAATNAIWVNDTNLGEEEFAYDHVFEGFTNHSVYGILGKRLLKSIFDGYNCCVFAYGQTGSGKTHTMIGSNSDPGIIPQLCQDLFARIEELRTGAEEGQAFKTEVEVEYMEIYNEKIRDLFSGNKEHKDSMKVREHPKKGVYVEGVIRKVVDTAEDIAQLMEAGNKERAVAKTDMNAVSSRSHAIFIIRFTQSCMEVDEETGKEVVSSQKTSCVNLVDLASAPPSPLRSPARLLAIPDEGAEIAAHSIGDLLGADVPPIHDPRLTGCIWRDRCSAVPGCQASPRSAMHLGVTPQIDACTGRRA